MRRFLVTTCLSALCVLFFVWTPLVGAQPLKTQNVILVMNDGLRWEEVFRGAEPLLESAKPGGVILAGQELPRSFAVGGALRTEINGRSALVAMATVEDGLVEELRARWNADVSVEDLNLEEIFMEMHLD
jgi:hypothetical protein